MENPQKSDHSATAGHVDIAQDESLDQIGLESSQFQEKATQYGMDKVDIDRLAHESLTLRSKATLRLAGVTFIWGMSKLSLNRDFGLYGLYLSSNLLSQQVFSHSQLISPSWGLWQPCPPFVTIMEQKPREQNGESLLPFTPSVTWLPRISCGLVISSAVAGLLSLAQSFSL